MEKLKNHIILELKILNFPYRKTVTFLYVVVAVIATFYMLTYRSFMDIRKHQAFLVVIMIWLMFGLQFLLLFMSCFCEKKYRKQLMLVCNAVEECDFKTTDYWGCAQMFMQFAGLKTNVAAVTKMHWIFYGISKLSAAGLNIVTLCLFVCLRATFSDIMEWEKHVFFSILIISILCLEIIYSYYICSELYPGTKATGMGLIIEYSLLLVLAQYIGQMKNIFAIFEPNVQKFWCERLEIISEFFFGTTLVLIIFLILFWSIRKGGDGTGIIWRRIVYYDQFADVYSGMAQSLHNIQNDTMVMEYFADITGKRVLLYEKRKWLYEQYCIFSEYLDKLTEDMKKQFAPLLELLPFELIEMVDDYYTDSII